MPCNSITVQSVGGLENGLSDLVKAALSAVAGSQAVQASDGSLSVYAVGLGVSVTWAKGRGLELLGRSQARLDSARGAVLQAYSKSAVAWAARRAGWRVQPVAGSVNRLVVQRG